jgi:DNA-binding response OmpR family regulator
LASADPGRIRVHVLTDDERLRESASALREDRFDVVISSDPAGTVASVRGRGDEVAVLELQLGAYGGFAVAKDLHAVRPDVHLVMVCDRPHDAWLCRQAGAEAVLVKPLPDPADLEAAIESVVKASRTG